MITQITSSNRDEYIKLFNEALIDLRKDNNMNVVTTVNADNYVKNKYYIKNESNQYILATSENYNSELTYYTLGENLPTTMTTLQEYFYYLFDLKENEKYLVLPLDEPHFEIDANTRSIKIPDEFRKHGVGVQGDHGAEVLYFKINRFFDAMDFGREDVSIIIQWKTEKKSGTSPIFCRDIESDPDYVIFGWELTDDITTAGKVEFSVRILKWETETKYMYSFSTLTAIVAINPALQLSENLKPDYNVSNSIKNRIDRSPLSNAVISLKPPVFVIPERQGEDFVDLQYDEEKDEYYLDLIAQAYPGSQGEIQYSWYKNDKIDNNKTKIDYREVTYNTPNYNIIYYSKLGNEQYAIYPLQNNEPFPKDENDNRIPLYEKIGYKTIDQTGTYTVKATANGVYTTSPMTESKFLWKVLEPNPLRVEAVVNNKIILELNEENGKYEGDMEIKVLNPNDYHYITYKWIKTGKNDSLSQTPSYEIETELTNSIETNKNIQGKYEVIIQGTKNNSQTEDYIQDFIVTFPAIKPNIKFMLENNSEASSSVPSDSKIIASISYPNDYQLSDYQSTSYKWYKYVNQGALDSDRANAEKGLYTPSEQDVEMFPINNETPNTFVPTTRNEKFYCMVTNNYNGNEITISSPFFETY